MWSQRVEAMKPKPQEVNLKRTQVLDVIELPD